MKSRLLQWLPLDALMALKRLLGRSTLLLAASAIVVPRNAAAVLLLFIAVTSRLMVQRVRHPHRLRAPLHCCCAIAMPVPGDMYKALLRAHLECS